MDIVKVREAIQKYSKYFEEKSKIAAAEREKREAMLRKKRAAMREVFDELLNNDLVTLLSISQSTISIWGFLVKGRIRNFVFSTGGGQSRLSHSQEEVVAWLVEADKSPENIRQEIEKQIQKIIDKAPG